MPEDNNKKEKACDAFKRFAQNIIDNGCNTAQGMGETIYSHAFYDGGDCEKVLAQLKAAKALCQFEKQEQQQKNK